MTFEVGYAYPSSTHAKECGAMDSGCYIVQRTLNPRTGAPLKSPVLATKTPFATAEAAQAWVDGK